jgi:hypothetical protein
MLSLSSQLRLKNLLMALAVQEGDIEKRRQKLCSFEFFEPYQAFRLIDTLSNRKITVEDIEHLFK